MLVSWSASASKIPTIYDKCSSKITTGDHLPRIHKLHESLRPPPLGDVWKTPQKRNHGSNHWIDKGRRGGNPEEVYLVDTSSPRKRIRSSNLASSPTGVIILPQPKQGTISGKSFKITIKLNTKGKSLQNYHINLHCLIPPPKKWVIHGNSMIPAQRSKVFGYLGNDHQASRRSNTLNQNKWTVPP